MLPIISFVNLKGGVGKTALAVNFAAYCARDGLKTLLVDLDPQTNATFSCITVAKWQTHAATQGTVADLMGMKRHTAATEEQKTAESVIIKDVFPNMDLLPSHLDLFTIDLDLAGSIARETKLKRALNTVMPTYQMIICDCPPNLTIPTQNALAMSTDFVVPISPDFLSALGLGILLSRVTEFSKDLDHNLNLLGIVISRKGRPATHRDEVVSDIRSRFSGVVLATEIAERVAVSEAAAANKSIYDLRDASAIAEFNAFSKELLLKKGVIK
jgi:chromosome partitioning protein